MNSPQANQILEKKATHKCLLNQLKSSHSTPAVGRGAQPLEQLCGLFWPRLRSQSWFLFLAAPQSQLLVLGWTGSSQDQVTNPTLLHSPGT